MNNGGKPPKTGSQIRTKLESISRNAEVVRHSGPINDRTRASRKIIVASFFDHPLGRKFQRELNRCELYSESVVKDRKLVITVDYADARTASAMSAKFRDKHPDRRNPLDSTRYDYLIFGTVIGFASAMIFIVGAVNQTAMIAFGLAAMGFFAASGHFLDRARGGKFTLGLWDLLVLVAIVGTAVKAIMGAAIFATLNPFRLC